MAEKYSRIAQAIRAIVLDVLKDNRDEGLTNQQGRDPIPGKRGIGYMFPDGLNAGSVSGLAGSTVLGSALGSLSQFMTNEEIEKIKNAEENKPKSITNVLNIHIGGKAMAVDGVEDCATGKDIEVINTPEFKPPAGWIGPNTPEHEYERFTLGVKWRGGTGGPPTDATTPLAAAKLERDAAGSGAYTLLDDAFFNGAFPHSGGNSQWVFQFKNPALPPTDLGLQYYSMDIACSPSGTTGTCPTSFTIPWPVDNKMQLARGKDGKFRVSANEPAGDVVSAYTDNQHSQLDLCFADGSGRKATIEPTYDGGWMVYEKDGAGLPTGKATRFDTTNTAVEQFNTDEIFKWRPS